MQVSEFTKDEALAFIEAMRLTIVDRVGFRWMVEKLSSLAVYIENTANDDERLNAFLDQTHTRDAYDSYCATLPETVPPDHADDAPGSIAEAGQAAETSFTTGLYCAESVVLAIARAQGIESEILPRVATGFCSGVARTCGTCGALTGAIMGIGLALGRDDADGSIEPSYEATANMVAQFEDEFGSRDCAVLLGCDLGTPEGQAWFDDHDLMARCTNLTRRSAEMAIGSIREQG